MKNLKFSLRKQPVGAKVDAFKLQINLFPNIKKSGGFFSLLLSGVFLLEVSCKGVHFGNVAGLDKKTNSDMFYRLKVEESENVSNFKLLTNRFKFF